MWMWTVRGAVRGNIVSGQIQSAISFPTRLNPDRGMADNAKAFDLLFVLNPLVRMKLLAELLIMNGQKIMCLKVENVIWLESQNYLAMHFTKLPETIGHTSHKS
jgi:hypothetical protein